MNNPQPHLDDRLQKLREQFEKLRAQLALLTHSQALALPMTVDLAVVAGRTPSRAEAS